MRIVIGYHPCFSDKGTATVSQNRQFQWLKHPFLAYPVVMASAATMASNAGHSVKWYDGIASDSLSSEYEAAILKFNPDIILWETKTPIADQTNRWIQWAKDYTNARVIVCGDHATARPYDFDCDVLIGGNYDFSLMQLLGQPQQKIPLIDRELTLWRMYAKRNGNFKSALGAYTMFSRDCWHRQGGGCSFCSWTNLYPSVRTCSVDEAMAEVENCISKGAHELFDDSGTFPVGEWLHEFTEKLRRFTNGSKTFSMGCNMRNGALQREDWKALRSAGFRFVLLGLESAGSATLKRLNKGYDVHDIRKGVEDASRAGLDVHVTAMVGFPWESEEDARATVELCKDFFRRGWIKSVQATLCIPYPGTALYKEAEEKEWLRHKEWERWDMSEPVLKCPIPDKRLMELISEIYSTALTPKNVIRNVLSEDVRELFRKARYLCSHILSPLK